MTLEPWIKSLGFPEAPRWHAGRLWFSDFGDRLVRAVDVDGAVTEVVRVPERPSGLGFLPDGNMLVVSMLDQRVLRFADGQLSTHGELGGFTRQACNDMVVSTSGNAYVGHMGFDLMARPPQVRSAELLLVRMDGTCRIAADELMFPNGVVLSVDERTLIVAETFGARLTAFDVAPDGSLSGRRVFAELPGRRPDGICLDAEGAVWVADAGSKACVRVREGGAILDQIATPRNCYACALGGADGRTLFLCTADGFDPDALAGRTAVIECARVEVAAALA